MSGFCSFGWGGAEGASSMEAELELRLEVWLLEKIFVVSV